MKHIEHKLYQLIRATLDTIDKYIIIDHRNFQS